MICPLAPAIVQSFNRAQLFILAAGLGEERQPAQRSRTRGPQRRYRQFLSTVWEWPCQCWLSSRRRKASARLESRVILSPETPNIVAVSSFSQTNSLRYCGSPPPRKRSAKRRSKRRSSNNGSAFRVVLIQPRFADAFSK